MNEKGQKYWMEHFPNLEYADKLITKIATHGVPINTIPIPNMDPKWEKEK